MLFNDPADLGNLISGSAAFSKSSLNIWKFTVHVLLKPGNQSILKEISPEYSLEGLMLKLKLHYFGHLMPRTDSLEKILRKIEGRRKRGQQRMR